MHDCLTMLDHGEIAPDVDVAQVILARHTCFSLRNLLRGGSALGEDNVGASAPIFDESPCYDHHMI